MLAGSRCLPAVVDALTAEGEACLAALVAAMEKGISNVLNETDSMNLVSALQSNNYDQAPGGVVFRETRHMVDLHFHVVGIPYVPRSCNRCAHELARSGLNRDPDHPCIWDDPLPSFVSDLVGRDLTDPLRE